MSYLRPHRLEDALDWLAAESPLVMAGCTDIYPLHQTPSLDGPLLDITGLDELRGTLIGLLQAPASKLARLLNEPAAQLARVMEAKSKQDA